MKLRNHLLSISIYRIMIQQAETKIRQSNFELLRLVAMFMIVLGHANQSSIGVVSREDIFSNPFDSFLRLFLQQFCTVSVNVFILISGWFGIRSTIKGFANMMFQVFFFSSIILIGALMLHVEIHPQSYFTLIGGGYWFIIEYSVLYILSPILNSYVESCSRLELRRILCAFFAMEFVYGWVLDFGRFLTGYSAISFVGLYLLARYLRIYPTWITRTPAIFSMMLFFTTIFATTLLCFYGEKFVGARFVPYAYSSPFVIVASVFIFAGFSKIKVHSKFVNSLAVSCLSIYLVHMHPVVFPYFQALMRSIYEHVTVPVYYFIVASIVAFVIGMMSILIDRIRLFLWQKCLKKILSKYLV